MFHKLSLWDDPLSSGRRWGVYRTLDTNRPPKVRNSPDSVLFDTAHSGHGCQDLKSLELSTQILEL